MSLKVSSQVIEGGVENEMWGRMLHSDFERVGFVVGPGGAGRGKKSGRHNALREDIVLIGGFHVWGGGEKCCELGEAMRFLIKKDVSAGKRRGEKSTAEGRSCSRESCCQSERY